MAYVFNPPTVEEGPAGFGWLFWRYRIARANTILVYGTSIVSERTPGVRSEEHTSELQSH